MTIKPTKRVHEFNFKGEGAHVALVDKAANLTSVLSMKAQEKEVQVTLSMKEFLKKFFSLWEEDAAQLAGILGYSSEVYNSYLKENGEYMTDQEYIASKIESVQLLKGHDISDTLPESIALKVEELNKKFGDSLKISEESPLEVSPKNNGDSQVTELETLKAQLAEFEVKKAAELAEMESLKSELSNLKTVALEKAKSEMTEVVKGFSFIPEADQPATIEFLLKSEGSEVILTALEKARNAIAAAVVEETGVEGGEGKVEESVVEKTASLVGDILKARKD